MIEIFQNTNLIEIKKNSTIIVPSKEVLKYKKKYKKNDIIIDTFDNIIRKLIVKYSNKKIVSEEESYLFMYKAFNMVKKDLKIYKNLSNYEFYYLLIDTYDIYKEYSCLKNDKIHDLTLIYNKYDELLKLNSLISFYNAYYEALDYLDNLNEDNFYFINLKKINKNEIKFINKLKKIKNIYIYANTINNTTLVEKLNEISNINYKETSNLDVNNLYKIGTNNLFKDIPIVSCNDLYEEVKYVYLDIIKKVNSGLKYKDILIVSSDILRYKYYFDIIFDIPYNKSENYGVLTKNFIHILSDILNGNFSCFNFICLLKLNLFDLDYKDINELDNYIYQWNLSDELFYNEFKYNPSGKRNFTVKDYEVLNKLNDLRIKVLNSFKYLLENTVNEKSVSENLKYLFMYLEEEKIIDKLFSLDSYGYNKLIDILELVNDYIKEGTLPELLKLIDFMYKPFSKNISMKDEITIINQDEYYDNSYKMVYFIGVTEKDVPAKFSFNTLINDSDLSSSDVFKMINEFNDFKKNSISNILLNQNAIITYHKLTDSPSKVLMSPLLNKFSSDHLSFKYNLNILNNKNLDIHINKNLAKKLYGTDITLSPSSLEMFSKCKYSYFLNYGLKLKIKEKYIFDNREVGTFVHFILEKVFENNLDNIENLNIRSIVDEYSELYFSLNVRNITNTLKYVINELKESTVILIETILLEFKENKFKPFHTEFKIKELKYKTSLDDGNLFINGIVDRVDMYEDDSNFYFRIIDYKTGSKKFRLDDILIGLNMQMLLYLLAIKNSNITNKNIVPTGFLYYPSLVHYKKENIGIDKESVINNLKSSLKMNGIINKDYLSLYNEDKIGDFIDIKTRNKISDEKVLSTSEMNLVFKKIESVLKDEGNSMLNGDISINPINDYKNDSCKYCKFDSVCAFNSLNQKARRYKSLNKKDVLNIIEGDINGMDN